ncbi:hypothetical protein D9619_011860 [Psilocybe cf. subviscida]|uniref:Uncharacterized protein n=1 Tax=Psilocybe cf. subviscida TaxID=2480587 RepID=A0A8H5B0B0_9AGAR|nr:hypothetical protein D9619_011860 [Psilocybe cf. subviscida]
MQLRIRLATQMTYRVWRHVAYSPDTSAPYGVRIGDESRGHPNPDVTWRHTVQPPATWSGFSPDPTTTQDNDAMVDAKRKWGNIKSSTIVAPKDVTEAYLVSLLKTSQVRRHPLTY